MRTIVSLLLLAVCTLPATAAAAQTDADKATARRISSHLEQSGQLRNYRIGVTHEDGVAMLTGTVASAEQRDVAIRLAEQVSGVSHVICRLQYPSEAESPFGNDGGEMSDAFNEATPASAQSGPSGVVQAYEESIPANAAPIQHSPMMSRVSSRNNRPRQMPRGNMP